MSTLRVDQEPQFRGADKPVHQNTSRPRSTWIKVGGVVFGLLLVMVGGGLYFSHVNAIAAYTAGGIGGSVILGVAVWSIINCLRGKKTKVKPPIKPLMVEDQEFIKESNKTLSKYEKIPLLPRNSETSWPLLQISYFGQTAEGKYELATGGGKCHNFNMPFYFLARLLEKTFIRFKTNTLDRLFRSIGAGTYELDGSPQIKIGNTYDQCAGYNIDGIYINDMENPKDELGNKLHNIQNLIQTTRDNRIHRPDRIFFIGEYEDKVAYTKEQLQKAIKRPELAIFIAGQNEGQIYVDLGELFENIDKGVFEFFENIFQVKAFQNTLSSNMKEDRDSGKIDQN